MKMAIGKVKDETLRLKLIVADDYRIALMERPDLVDEIANGVGSETEGWLFHLTPDTNWGMNINPVSHNHDWMYTFPLSFKSVAEGLAYKLLADHWFDLNHGVMIADGAAILNNVRTCRRKEYNELLSMGGSEAFWADKPLPPDYDYYYSERPQCNPVRLQRLIEIEAIVTKLFEAKYDFVG